MNNKKNIDRLFQEKFKDFEVAPNDAVWNRISESLPNKKKKRRVIALWWQIGGVAAVIALLLTVGVSVFNSDDNNNQQFPIVNTEDKDNGAKDNNVDSSTNDKQDELNYNKIDKLEFVGSDTDKESILDETENSNSTTPKQGGVSNPLTTSNKAQSNAVANTTNKNEKVQPSQKLNNLKTILKKETTTKVAENTKNTEKTSKQSEETKLASESELKLEFEKTIDNNKTATVDSSTPNKTDSESAKAKNSELKNTDGTDIETAFVEDPIKESILEAIAEKESEPINEKEEKENRWSIMPNVAPVYYSSFGKGSSIDQQFNENSKSSDINMSYGIAGSYAISKKLKVRAGINRVNLNQLTSGVYAITSPNPSPSSSFTVLGEAPQKYVNITLNNNAQSVSLMSTKTMVSAADFSSQKVGNIDQRLGFIEVPLELEYRVLDKKFGINIIGGFSTFFLNENELYADIEGASTLIGEANNINSTSYSANFGLGLDYSLSKQWNINLEPQFKYQLNTFNNTSGNYRPFFVGVYTGLSFKF